jgi:rubrerythrin
MKGIEEMRAEKLGPSTDPLEFAGYVVVHATGDAAAGEFHCRQCGYGVTVQRLLPRCPMCGGTAWEPRGLGALRRRVAGLPQ